MDCYLKATIEVSLDKDSTELQEDMDLVEQYKENWNYLPENIQKCLEQNMSHNLKWTLKVVEIK